MLDGSTLGHLWVFRDVTAQAEVRRTLEERNRILTELSALKTEFVAVLSHELRTPLTSIATFAGMLDAAAQLGPDGVPRGRRRHPAQRRTDAWSWSPTWCCWPGWSPGRSLPAIPRSTSPPWSGPPRPTAPARCPTARRSAATRRCCGSCWGRWWGWWARRAAGRRSSSTAEVERGRLADPGTRRYHRGRHHRAAAVQPPGAPALSRGAPHRRARAGAGPGDRRAARRAACPRRSGLRP